MSQNSDITEYMYHFVWSDQRKPRGYTPKSDTNKYILGKLCMYIIVHRPITLIRTLLNVTL